MRRLYPAPSDELDDVGLRALYAPTAIKTLRVNAITSIDGASSVHGYSGGLSNRADKRIFRVLRGWADVILVGAGTVAVERYRSATLSAEQQEARAAEGLLAESRFAVWSARLSIEPTNAVFHETATPPLVFTTDLADPVRLEAISRFAEVRVLSLEKSQPDAIVASLRADGYRSILCEGGPAVLGQMFDHDLVDELCVSLAARIVGPGSPRIVAGGQQVVDLRYDLSDVLLDRDMLFLRYHRARSSGERARVR